LTQANAVSLLKSGMIADYLPRYWVLPKQPALITTAGAIVLFGRRILPLSHDFAVERGTRHIFGYAAC
jgi:hypothetical protein